MATTAPKKTAPSKAAPSKAPVKSAPAKAAPVKTATKKTEAAAKPAPVKVRLKEISEIVAGRLPVASATVTRVLEEGLVAIREQFAQGNIIELKDIGKMQIDDRPARIGRNPATNEQIEIAAKRVPKFRFSKPMKDLVAGA